MQAFEFDYKSYWRLCVKEYNIQPSEAWSLDFAEVKCLAEVQDKEEQDISLMLNYERMDNGASAEWLGLNYN